MGKVRPQTRSTFPQHDVVFVPLMADKGHEFLVSVHVENTGGECDDDAGEAIKQHTNGRVEQERLILVKDILRAQHLHLVHNGNATQGQ